MVKVGIDRKSCGKTQLGLAWSRAWRSLLPRTLLFRSSQVAGFHYCGQVSRISRRWRNIADSDIYTSWCDKVRWKHHLRHYQTRPRAIPSTMTELTLDLTNPEGHAVEAMKAQTGLLDQFILFGDSITQQACSQERGFAFQPALQNGKLLLEKQPNSPAHFRTLLRLVLVAEALLNHILLHRYTIHLSSQYLLCFITTPCLVEVIRVFVLRTYFYTVPFRSVLAKL